MKTVFSTFSGFLLLRLAEMKGTTATDYGLIIGTNCLVAFLVTPFVGNQLPFIGVKYAYCFGTFAGGGNSFLLIGQSSKC